MSQLENGIEILYTIYRGNRSETKQYPATILIRYLREFIKENPTITDQNLSFILTDLPRYVQNALYVNGNGPHVGLDDSDFQIQTILELLTCDEDLQYFNKDAETHFIMECDKITGDLNQFMKSSDYLMQ
jgi:hypothetical protein